MIKNNIFFTTHSCSEKACEVVWIPQENGKQIRDIPKPTLCHNRLILATCCDCLMIPVFLIRFSCEYHFSVHKLHTKGKYAKVMKQTMLDHMSVIITVHLVREGGSKKGLSDSLPVG